MRPKDFKQRKKYHVVLRIMCGAISKYKETSVYKQIKFNASFINNAKVVKRGIMIASLICSLIVDKMPLMFLAFLPNLNNIYNKQ